MKETPKNDPLPDFTKLDWFRDPVLQVIWDFVERSGDEARIVGGAVRDTLLGRAVADIDFATPVRPETLLAQSGQSDVLVKPTGLDQGTVTLISQGKPFQVTTLRRDIETDGRHAKVDFGNDWTEDARRRDFTINALYLGRDGHLFDPLNGLEDLNSGTLKFIGDPRARIREDYLRILRFFRFHAELACEQFDEQGLRAVISEKAGLELLSRERVTWEIMKLFAATGAGPVVACMEDAKLMTVLLGGRTFLDRFQSQLQLETDLVESGLGQKQDALLRLAQYAIDDEDDERRLCRKLRFSNAEQDRLEIFSEATDAIESPVSDSEIRKMLYRRGRQITLDDLSKRYVRAKLAGKEISHEILTSQFTLAETWVIPEFPVRGADLLAAGKTPGPGLGRILDQLEQIWIESEFKLDKVSLLTNSGVSD